MKNIIDYLNEYGKYSFKEKPFNEVDNVCICYMFYAGFDEYFDLRKAYTIKELAALLYFDYEEEIKKSKSLVYGGPIVLEAMARTNRFKDAVLTNFVAINNDEKTERFCAGTLELSNNISYIIFRGTKDSLINWKESLNLIYKKIESQVDAARYLKKYIKKDKKYYVGGHSKGGTLASYAALMHPELHNNIIKVYSNDGPGLNPKILPKNYHESFKTLSSKYCKIIPEFDIFGAIFSSSRKKRIIKSDGIALKQHDAMLWHVKGDRFVDGKPLKRVDVLRNTFEELVDTVTDKEFEQFINNYTDLLLKGGVDEIDGNLENVIPAIFISLTSINDMSESSKKVLSNLVKLLIREGINVSK